MAERKQKCVTCGGLLEKCVLTRERHAPDWVWRDDGFIWMHAEPDKVTTPHFPKSKADAPHVGPQALPDLHPIAHPEVR